MNEDLSVSSLMYTWAKDLPPKVITKISPSQVGGCMRKHWYSIKGAPVTTPTNPGYILNMQTGFMWEDIIEKSLEHSHLPFIKQWKMVSTKFNMEGTLDFGLIDPKTGELEILDSKTESSKAKMYRKGGYLASHEDYVHQLNCYAIMAREYGFAVERGRFVVIERDDSFAEDFPFLFDDLRIAQTIERIEALQKHLDNNTLPPCDGKFCKIGLCDFGNPETRKENSKGKLVNTSCCPVPVKLKEWADKLEQDKLKEEVK